MRVERDIQPDERDALISKKAVVSMFQKMSGRRSFDDYPELSKSVERIHVSAPITVLSMFRFYGGQMFIPQAHALGTSFFAHGLYEEAKLQEQTQTPVDPDFIGFFLSELELTPEQRSMIAPILRYVSEDLDLSAALDSTMTAHNLGHARAVISEKASAKLEEHTRLFPVQESAFFSVLVQMNVPPVGELSKSPDFLRDVVRGASDMRALTIINKRLIQERTAIPNPSDFLKESS